MLPRSETREGEGKGGREEKKQDLPVNRACHRRVGREKVGERVISLCHRGRERERAERTVEGIISRT